MYLSHLLEHLPRAQAPALLQECRRVLRRGGVLRVVVPDLEQIVGLYAQSIAAAWQGDAGAEERHAWLQLELLDQMTRETAGGRMAEHLQALDNADALGWRRLGTDAQALSQALAQSVSPPRWRTRLSGWLFGSWRERLLRWLSGNDYPLLQLGRFRRSGEVHHWMYDRVSLRAVLIEAGFGDVRVVGPKESLVPGWTDYHLDTLPDGTVAKPDSLYMEAIKV